jgi:hypothetical protein
MSKETDRAPSLPLQNRLPLERRQFLLIGSAALVGFAARDLKADVLRPAADAALPQTLSVAYVGGYIGDGLTVGSVKGSAPVEVAGRMTVGDPSFLGKSARVTVLGLWRAEARRNEPLSVTVKAYYPTSLSAGGDAPMFAWNQTHRGLRDSVRRSSSVTVPIDQAGLRLEVESNLPQSGLSNVGYAVRRRVSLPAQIADSAPRAQAAIREQANVASLSLGIESGMAKLKQGTYVLALVPNGAKAPDWQAVRYTPSETGTAGGPVTVTGIFGDGPVNFDYIVVTVGFAH